MQGRRHLKSKNDTLPNQTGKYEQKKGEITLVKGKEGIIQKRNTIAGHKTDIRGQLFSLNERPGVTKKLSSNKVGNLSIPEKVRDSL